MKHFPFAALLCLLACLLTPCAHADTPALSAPLTRPTWAVLDTLTRLLPIDTYSGKTGGTLLLAGGRDEIADAQLAVFAAAQDWQGVRLRFSKLQGPKHSTLNADAFTWRRIASVQTQKPNYPVRYVGLWPDPLLPAAPFDVQANARSFAWITLHIPSNAAPGMYTGTLLLLSSREPTLRVPVTVRVWGYAMPRQSHLRTAFGTGFNGTHPADTNAVMDDLLAHRLSPTNCVGGPRLVPGQPPDWAQFDQNMTHRLAQGMNGFALIDPGPAQARLFQEHLTQKGWLKYAYVYAADEPEAAQYRALNQSLAAYKQAAPLLPIMVTARGYPPMLSHVDIWCAAMVVERNDFFQIRDSLLEQNKGRSSWWYAAYSSHAPTVNVWTDYPLLNERIWPWLTWKQGVDGILYWSVTNWQNTADPLHDARTYQDANGDGELLYPGPDGKPMDSMRLEALRDGMQDYEVLCLLDAGVRELNALRKTPALAQQAAALCAIDSAVIVNYRRFTTDPRVLLDTRARMSRTLEQIVAVLGHTPPVVGRPVYRPALPLAP